MSRKLAKICLLMKRGHIYLAAKLVAKKSAFVSLGLFKILPQASDKKKEQKMNYFFFSSLCF